MNQNHKFTREIYTVLCLIILTLLLGACAPQKPDDQPEPTKVEVSTPEIANPASQYCLEQEGTLSIVERGDGGQYGICYFEDNRQCEEWALYRGDCPVGGLKVTGYITQAAQYCAITGGTYAITGDNNSDNEQGTCTLIDGTVCDVWDYYNGKCSSGQAASPAQATLVGGGAAQIVFDSTRSGSYRDLYMMSSNGADVKRLTNGDSNSFAGPWSPDGQRIVYTAFGLTNSYIAVINGDGSGQTSLVSDQDSDEGFPDWSPDGTLIAFTSRRDGNNEIYLMNADGSNPLRLTNEPGDDFAPSWSPDGTQIVFVSDRDQSTGVYDLYIMNADGSGVTRLTNDTAIDYSPDWSPDGKQIVYRSHQDGPADIYIINIDGSGLRNLTNDPAEDWAPTWSPDGKYVAFQTNRDGNWEIYREAVDGSHLVNLTNDPGDDQLPYWRPSVAAGSLTSGTTSTVQVPLKDALNSLTSQDVLKNFYDITQVPRPSGSMDKIREFLVSFGQGLGLETVVDKAGNVIIRKPASAGLEEKPGVVLQAHMDMVAKKNSGKEFNFNTDPIQAFVSGDYIVTDGTTLGADDGIGIALIMAVLQSTELEIGPVEALFTADEETTTSGANGLDPETLKGRILINLDGETEGEFIIGSAGGEHVNIDSAYPQVSIPTGMVSYLVKVQGLQGGHSGVDINKGRGHATKLLVRLLKETAEPYELRLASLNGGTVVNAITDEASAIIFLADAQVEPFTNFASQFEDTIKSELAATEPDLSVSVEPVQPPAQVMDEAFQALLIDALYGIHQGVFRMSDAVPGLVETSINLGITVVQDGEMQIIYFPRSSVDTELQDASQMITSVWELAGYQAEITDSFAAWTPNSDSQILDLMKTTYKDLFGHDPNVIAIHAGLECGAISGNYPDMDMISIGPTLEAVHSSSEKLYIPDVGKVMDLLESVLQRLAEG